jgi:2-haloacid dehalogenase
MILPEIKTIIFDLGGVLIDWNPLYLYKDLIKDENERSYFFQNVCTSEWNEEQDAGRSLEEATSFLVNQFPQHKEHIEVFYGRWEEMLKGPIQETVEILDQIRQSSKYRLYALTNWSHETFGIALKRFDFLQWFEGIVVSGEEKTRKPFPEIYQILLSRYNVEPRTALFIDDSLRNINGAKTLGINTIYFTEPSILKEELQHFGVFK